MNRVGVFWAELKRRHVYRVGAAYAVGGWLLVQIVTQVLPIFHVSELGQRLLVIAVIAGFPVAVLLAWIYDLTPQGIVRTPALPEAKTPPPAVAKLPTLEAGQSPPLRPDWRLVERLDAGGHGEVWLAANRKTHEQRIYKFAQQESSTASLKREITVSRLLHDSLGERAAPFIRVLDWNLDVWPHFIECEYASGGSLVTWAEARGGIAAVPLAERLELVRQIAEALAAAHSIDVLHKDLKPSNVLIEPGKAGPRVRLCDFGSGDLLDPARLSALQITQMGFTRPMGSSGQTSGTPAYFSPELLGGAPATRQSDLYSLGVILYQLVIGDLRRPLAPGWEHDVDDPVLRRLVADAAAGNPQRRMKTAEAFVERLREWRGETVCATPAAVSLAVLPFLARGGEAGDGDLGSAIGEEIGIGLGRIEGLEVVAGSGLGADSGKAASPLALGRRLGVEQVVTGELKRDGERLRLGARLVRVDDGAELWSQAEESAFDDLLLAQETLARGLVAALGREPPATPVTRPGTASPAAYHCYLRGRSSWMSQDDATNRGAIVQLERAIALDPTFARAHSQLSYACCSRVYFIDPDDGAALKLGFAAAERALLLDPELAEAHLARGQLAFSLAANFAYALAIKEFKRAIAVNGRLASAWAQLSAVYYHVGLIEEALSAAHRGCEADPADGACRFMAAQMPVWAGEYEHGLDRLERLPRGFNPTLWYYATLTALLALDRVMEADARLNEFFRQHQDKGGLMSALRARILATRGRRDEALQAIAAADAADRRFGHFHHTAYEIANTQALLGRRDDALKHLREAVQGGFLCLPYIERDRCLQCLREDAEFQAILDAPRKQCAHYRTL